jgi:DUF1680 family protein
MSTPNTLQGQAQGGRARRVRPAHAVVWGEDSVSAKFRDGFLRGRTEINRSVSLLYGLEQLEAGGNLHNLRVAAGGEGQYHPTLTLDADVHKWVEAVGWELGRGETPDLRTALESVVQLLLDAQESSGYLNSWFQAVEPDRKLVDLTRGCEMYCAGHLIEAGVVLSRTLGDRRLLEAAAKFADLLLDTFGPEGRAGIDGHEEVELALVELYRETGQQRYLELAQRFIDARGHGLVGPGVFGPRYYQDHEPVRDASTITGHAVRAMYLNTGATDVYLETGDRTLLQAMERQWEAMVSSKMYLTGGLGSRERDEAIGEPYELPPDRAYCETCAAAGLIFWNWKLLLATGDARYADLLERTFYNAFLAGVSLDGRSYFYANPLEVRAEYEPPFESEWSGETPWYISPAPEQATAHRRPWFRCACCPPNVMRVLSSFERYLATTSSEGLELHQYTNADVRADIDDGSVGLRVTTDYPWDGRVTVTITESPAQPWRLSLRVPAWATGATIESQGTRSSVQPGYWSERRTWSAGETVVLDVPMAPRLTSPMPRASAIFGCLAIERGPLVYCIEQADNPDINLADVVADRAAPLTEVDGPSLVDGMVAVSLPASVRGDRSAGTWGYPPAADTPRKDTAPVPLIAIPYFAWANRGANAMRVWIPSN